MKFIFIFLIAASIVSCIAQTPTEMEQEDNLNPTMTYLALGDSYTIGESVSEQDRWPVLLVKSLKENGIEFSAPRILAKTGWTTGELLTAIENEQIEGQFDLVTLLIGVNNQYRGYDIEEFRTEYIQLLDIAIAFAQNDPAKVIIVSIPDWGVSPFAAGQDLEKISKKIDAFNAIKKEETLKKSVKFVDITEISRKALYNSLYIAEDGLHFSGAMHQLWVNEIIRTCY
jgi:lysophospholipase L1-like esterase